MDLLKEVGSSRGHKLMRKVVKQLGYCEAEMKSEELDLTFDEKLDLAGEEELQILK